MLPSLTVNHIGTRLRDLLHHPLGPSRWPSRRQGRRLWRSLAGLAAVVVVAALVIWAADPADGQEAPTFACDGSLFLVTGTPESMQLVRVDPATAELTPVGGGGSVANAIGFNHTDGFIYGTNYSAPHNIVRLDADGNETDLGVASGTPASWDRVYVGTFLENGNYLVLGDDGPPGTETTATWAEIDVTTTPPTVVRTASHPSLTNNDLWDVAVHPETGVVYGHSRRTGGVVTVNTATGAITGEAASTDTPALAGSTFFDSGGRLWLYGTGTEPGIQNRLYRIDDPDAGRARIVGEGPAVTQSDGTGCPFGIDFTKSAHASTVCAGEQITYDYRLTNRFARTTTLTADFIDELPNDGRRFVADSLDNPLGGQPNDYGGADRLVVTGLELPADSVSGLSVDVLVPPDTAPGTVLNQAMLSGISANVGAEIPSEYPATAAAPDPTPVEVRSCVDLGVTKTTDATVAGPHDEVTYRIEVTNHGPSDAHGIDSLTDRPAPGTTVLRAGDDGQVTPFGTVSWPTFDLAAGETTHRSVTVTADRDIRAHVDESGHLVNTASVSHPGDTNPDNDADTAAVPTDRPDVSLTKDDGEREVEVGDELTYELVVRNAGPGVALDVTVTDDAPPGLILESVDQDGVIDSDGRVATWPPFDLDAGATRQLTVSARVDEGAVAGDDLLNVVRADVPDDLDTTDNVDEDRDVVVVPPPEPMVLTETAAPPTVTPVERLTGALARTGAAVGSLVGFAAALVAVGVAVYWFSRRRLT